MFQSGVKSIWTLSLLFLLTSCGGSDNNDTAGSMAEDTSSVATDAASVDAGTADGGSGDEGLTDAGSSAGGSVNNAGGGQQSTFPSGELNVSPVINQFSAAPSPLMVNDQIMFTWDISDVNTEDVLTCNLDVDSDGIEEFTVEDCADAGSNSFNYKKSGDFIATLTVTDFFNQTITFEAAVVVHPLMLSISSNGPVQAGERLQYEVTVSNVSLVPANDVNLLHRVSSGIAMDNSDDSIPDATSNCFFCPEGSEFIWRIGTLQAGQSLTLAINADVLPDLAPDTSITAPFGPLDVLSTVKRTTTLTASTDVEPAKILEFESDLTFNGVGNRGISARHTTTVSELASPISMSVLPTTTGVSPGGNLGLNVTLTTTSLVPANNVILVYRLPANVSLDNNDDVEPNAISNCFSCIEGSEVVWRLGTIAAGASQQIQINANVSADVRRGALLVSPFTVFSDQLFDTVRLHNIVQVQ